MLKHIHDSVYAVQFNIFGRTASVTLNLESLQKDPNLEKEILLAFHRARPSLESLLDSVADEVIEKVTFMLKPKE